MSAPSDRELRLDELRRAAQPAIPPKRGYYGHPVLKPPVWTWEIPVYFFVGGTAGMAAVLAAASLASEQSVLVARSALWIAAAGALLSAPLLISDLGRPGRFFNMLRVFKWRSPMSVGVWLLLLFSALVVPAAVVMQLMNELSSAGMDAGTLSTLVYWLTLASALVGSLLAVYTAVLLGATVVPVWFRHRVVLPLHFGFAGLGSAAALLELVGHRLPALGLVGFVAALVETGVGVWVEVGRRGAQHRAAHRGRAGWALRLATILSGPAALLFRFMGVIPVAALSFVAGALLSRFGWIWAGRASALDAEAVFDVQRDG